MATIGDVAKRAGVSRSTVSYALSGKRSISSETRERISDAIAELGFTPNAGARALATSQTMVIGLFVHFYEDEFSPAMLQYVLPISDAAREAGYDILMVTETNGPQALSRITKSDMVDGIVLLNVAHRDERIPVLQAARQPGVLVGIPDKADGVDVFDLDFEESGRMLVDHLHERGHRDIILVTPQQHVFERGGAYAWRFRDAALERASRYGIRVFSVDGVTQQPGVNRQINEILDGHPEATAMIVHNDATIAALPSVLHDGGSECRISSRSSAFFLKTSGGCSHCHTRQSRHRPTNWVALRSRLWFVEWSTPTPQGSTPSNSSSRASRTGEVPDNPIVRRKRCAP